MEWALFFIFAGLAGLNGFNVDTKYAILKEVPDKLSSSYFGYSVAQHAEAQDPKTEDAEVYNRWVQLRCL